MQTASVLLSEVPGSLFSICFAWLWLDGSLSKLQLHTIHTAQPPLLHCAAAVTKVLMYIKIKKIKDNYYSSSRESISKLWSITCHMGSHSAADEHEW